MISKVDYIAVPTEDVERSRSFYVETLGLRPDGNDFMLHRRYAPPS